MKNRHNKTIKHAGFLKPVEKSYEDAQCNIGLINHTGYGIPQDFVLGHDGILRIHYQ